MRTPIDTRWLIVTVRHPVSLHQTADEAWLLNPNRRYILNANKLQALEEHVSTVSEFSGSSLYQKLQAGKDIGSAKILVERCRERGLGDLLFMTGPLAYLNHITGNNVEIDVMGLSDRASVLTHSPLISGGTVKCGPLEYDALRHYNYHWFVDSATEQDSEPDQQNVYDALFGQLGYAPDDVEARWKRPSATLVNADYLALDQVYRRIWDDRKLELRRIGYYVVAPFSNATLRCMPYGRWLEIIAGLATRRPVVVVGNARLRLPDTDMSAGEFIGRLGNLGQAVVNAIDGTNIRTLMALISRATAAVTLDSGPLYIAQALNTPAISIWGTHAPGARIGYDENYMRHAIWNADACRRCPCFAYGEFPVDKCPDGPNQMVCEVLKSVQPEQVFALIDSIESTATKIQSLSLNNARSTATAQ